MTRKERFLAICRGETPDYVPILAFRGAPGMSGGAMEKTHQRLLDTGMPDHVGGRGALGRGPEESRVDSWCEFWGTELVGGIDFAISGGEKGFKWTDRYEGNYKIAECENGQIIRELIDNDITYSMPEHIAYPVRDRESWEFFKERATRIRTMSDEDMEANCRRFDDRDWPLALSAGGTLGAIRSLMGPETFCMTLYDDPELIHDIMQWGLENQRQFTFPLIERLRPEIVAVWEDISGNHAMMVSPAQFEEFGGDYYREVTGFARGNGVEMVTVDSDGNVNELVPLLASFGVNCLYPFEAKGHNDLFKIREELPEFILMGWLEKEVVNEGNEHMIEEEIRSKVPPLLEKGRYFPNGDHGIQPLVTYPNMLKFMTLLHEVCGNPEGTFPRV